MGWHLDVQCEVKICSSYLIIFRLFCRDVALTYLYHDRRDDRLGYSLTVSDSRPSFCACSPGHSFLHAEISNPSCVSEVLPPYPIGDNKVCGDWYKQWDKVDEMMREVHGQGGEEG